jgi:signal peptidase I
LEPANSLADVAQGLVEARLQAGSPVCFHVFTTSMLPALQPGDALIVERAAAAEVTPGALVVIRNGNAWVVHRLIRRQAAGQSLHLLTKGDHRLFADSRFEGALPVGVVKSIQRGNRSIDLSTQRARFGGLVIAWISRIQANLYRRPLGRLRKVILQSLYQGIYILAVLVYKP